MADVTLTCGCKTVVTHTSGDRLIHCRAHRRGYVVSVRHVADYEVREIPRDDPPDAA